MLPFCYLLRRFVGLNLFTGITPLQNRGAVATGSFTRRSTCSSPPLVECSGNDPVAPTRFVLPFCYLLSRFVRLNLFTVTTPLQNREAVATGSFTRRSTCSSPPLVEYSGNDPVATAPRFCSQWLRYARLISKPLVFPPNGPR